MRKSCTTGISPQMVSGVRDLCMFFVRILIIRGPANRHFVYTDQTTTCSYPQRRIDDIIDGHHEEIAALSALAIAIPAFMYGLYRVWVAWPLLLSVQVFTLMVIGFFFLEESKQKRNFQ